MQIATVQGRQLPYAGSPGNAAWWLQLLPWPLLDGTVPFRALNAGAGGGVGNVPVSIGLAASDVTLMTRAG